jgi:sulfide:quinone oxidoreductase
MQPRRLNDQIAVAEQISEADVAEIARLGFRSIINNRPDGEAWGQPNSQAIAAAAAAAGLGYRHVPVVSGRMMEADVTAFRQALKDLDGPVLAYCRSGTRSAILWAFATADGSNADAIVAAAATAGYDLAPMRGQLAAKR